MSSNRALHGFMVLQQVEEDAVEAQGHGMIETKRKHSDTVTENGESPAKKARAHHDVRYALTFGETAILHVGGKELGAGKRETGFTVPELEAIAARVQAAGGTTELYRLSDRLPSALRNDPQHEAATLVIRDGARFMLKQPTSDGIGPEPHHTEGSLEDLGRQKSAADRLYQEQQADVVYDKRFFDTRSKKTKNKQARYNIVFGPEDIPANEDYSQYTVCGFPRLAHLDQFRRSLGGWLGDKAEGLHAEGNLYYHEKGGIGFHGDAERKVVICLSLGKESVLRYHWRLPGSSQHTLEATDIVVRHGDVYVMSEKATGHDWRFRSKLRLVHAAGHAKYIGKCDLKLN